MHSPFVPGETFLCRRENKTTNVGGMCIHGPEMARWKFMNKSSHFEMRRHSSHSGGRMKAGYRVSSEVIGTSGGKTMGKAGRVIVYEKDGTMSEV